MPWRKRLFVVKAGLAAGVGASIALIPAVGVLARGYQAWLMLGVIGLAAGPTLGGITSRGGNVLAGTAVAAALSVPFELTCSTLPLEAEAAVIAIAITSMTSLGMLAIIRMRTAPSLAAWEYAAASCVLIFDMLLVMNVMEGSAAISATRAGAVGAGVAIGAVFTFVLPYRAVDALRDDVADSLRDVARLVPLVTGHFTQGVRIPPVHALITARPTAAPAAGAVDADPAHTLFLRLVAGRERQAKLGFEASWELGPFSWPRALRGVARAGSLAATSSPCPCAERHTTVPHRWQYAQLGRAVRALAYVSLSIDAHNRTYEQARAAGGSSEAWAPPRPASQFEDVPEFRALVLALEDLAAAMAASLEAAADVLDASAAGGGAEVRGACERALHGVHGSGSSAATESCAVPVRLVTTCAAVEMRLAAWIARAAAPTPPTAGGATIQDAIGSAHVSSVAALMLEMAHVRLAHVGELLDEIVVRSSQSEGIVLPSHAGEDGVDGSVRAVFHDARDSTGVEDGAGPRQSAAMAPGSSCSVSQH